VRVRKIKNQTIIFLLCFFRLIVRVGLYNKIRALKRQLAAERSKNSRPARKRRDVRSKPKKVPTASIPKDVDTPPLPALPVITAENNLATPEKEANTLLRKNAISPTKFPEIAKELTAYNTLASVISNAPTGVKKSLFSKKNDKKKPRCARRIAGKIKMHRQHVLSTMSRRRNNRRQEIERNKKLVVNFLKRNDNSIELPSKKDALIKGITRYALNDTLKNIYNRFTCEFPSVRMSFATFCRQKPKWVKCIKWASRRQCLCLRHQNAALKLKCIRSNSSPNLFVLQNSREDIKQILQELPNEEFTFKMWKSVEVTLSQEKIVKKMRLHDVTLLKDDFISTFDEEFCELRDHIKRTTNQFQQTRKLRENLLYDEEVTVQLDYSENYTCVYQDEPAQVFYDRNQITIHPMVVHYMDSTGLVHQSFVGVTDINKHSAPTTVAFLSKLVPEIRKLKPELKVVHYISDSPANQYRNKYVVKFIAHHQSYFPDVKASWEFLEAGHGKGPCDGVGGSLKKSLETHVKKGNIVKCANDVLTWANSEFTLLKVLLINQQDISLA
jgi:hypothetical protein